MEPKANILIVDDNPDKLGLLEAALSLAGYNVTTATDGDEALAAIDSYQPDLVITGARIMSTFTERIHADREV